MGSPIKVVLQQDVESLGTSGDVVRVRAGYARNYLIPRQLAAPATPGNLAKVEGLKQQAAERAANALAQAQALKTKLEGLSVKLERAVGDENRMYGSVTGKDIEEAYLAEGVQVDRRRIALSEPLKTLGLHDVPIKLHPQVTATLRVEVVKRSS